MEIIALVLIIAMMIGVSWYNIEKWISLSKDKDVLKDRIKNLEESYAKLSLEILDVTDRVQLLTKPPEKMSQDEMIKRMKDSGMLDIVVPSPFN